MRAWAAGRAAWTFDQHFSIGFRSGEDGGKDSRRAPRPLIAACTRSRLEGGAGQRPRQHPGGLDAGRPQGGDDRVRGARGAGGPFDDTLPGAPARTGVSAPGDATRVEEPQTRGPRAPRFAPQRGEIGPQARHPRRLPLALGERLL